MMLSDESRTSGRQAACAAGRLDGAYWLIGPGSVGLAQGCRCVLPLQAWAGAYRGGRPPTACLKLLTYVTFSLLSKELIFYGRTLSDASMLYFADVFFLFFYDSLSWPNG